MLPNAKREYSYFDAWDPGFVAKTVVNIVLPGFLPAIRAAVKWANKNAKPTVEPRYFFMSPYVYFAPHAAAKPTAPQMEIGMRAQ